MGIANNPIEFAVWGTARLVKKLMEELPGEIEPDEMERIIMEQIPFLTRRWIACQLVDHGSTDPKKRKVIDLHKESILSKSARANLAALPHFEET